MSDYNDGLLPEPCLRMDTHFGDEYESVEFGDGTGYIKAAPTLARLGALHVELDGLRDENAKLRELVAAFDWCTENFDMPNKCDRCPLPQGNALEPECEVRIRELGVEVEW